MISAIIKGSALLSIAVMTFACSKSKSGSAAPNDLITFSHQDANSPDTNARLNYVFLKNPAQPGHTEIYQKNSKAQIVQKIHGLMVCGGDDNIISSTIVGDEVVVRCRATLWGDKIESRLRASISQATIYDVVSETFEEGRNMFSLSKVPGKVVIFGADRGGESSVLGVASIIPNLPTDPVRYQSKEGIEITDTQTNKTFTSKKMTGLNYDIAEFFKSEGVKGRSLAIQTTQHEIGHLFGLFHTFQFSDTVENDLIHDTPRHNIRDCSHITVELNIMSCCHEDRELRYFTQGQLDRMEKILGL